MQKLGFIFPGQGSQAIGMLQSFNQHPIVQKTFDQAAQVLKFDLWQLCQAGPADQLNATENAQPAILAASIALWRLWQAATKRSANLLAGHSLGEYSALVAADAIDFETAISLVATRGRLMQQAVPKGEGAMAAVLGLDDEVVEKLCQTASQSSHKIVAAANFNSIGQVVVSGNKNAVDCLLELAKQAGAKLAKLIPVSVPSHCALMQSAADELAKVLAQVKIKTPQIPVIQNVDVKTYSHPDDIRQALVQQLCKPVRWVETILFMEANQISCLIECGPGKVLNGLNKRISKEINTLNIDSKKLLEENIR